jgi:transposase InsO family protein
VISVDFIGPLPRSERGNTDLLVVSDWYSKYVLCCPMKRQCSKKLVEFLEKEVFLKWGVPERLISDNGPQFRSKIYKELLETYDIKALYSANYHAQNNPVERVNAVIEDSIRVYLGDDQRDWDLHLPKIMWAMNTSVHSTTKYTPYSQ